jgi:uncharacterized protein (DUF433 family)
VSGPCTRYRGDVVRNYPRETTHEIHTDYRRSQTDGRRPCIRGLRIPVATVVGMVADGMTAKDILAAYPDLEAGDIQEALQYAADAVRERELPLTVP